MLIYSKNPLKATGAIVISSSMINCFQDDNLSEFLTVRENLMFSANMRMVGKTSVEKYSAVDRMIELLHLERCQDTLVRHITYVTRFYKHVFWQSYMILGSHKGSCKIPCY